VYVSCRGRRFHVASAIEGVWYLSQEGEEFDRNFNLNLTVNFSPVLNRPPAVDSTHVSAIADALRQLDCLRQDGLISEYEFDKSADICWICLNCIASILKSIMKLATLIECANS